MAFHVSVTPEAEQDADKILNWLKEQQAGESGLRWRLKIVRSPLSCGSFYTAGEAVIAFSTPSKEILFSSFAFAGRANSC